jgi:3-phosphoshikimate 1-carboxyvinyltransferase
MLVPPLSKSDAQRALVLADVTGVPFERVLPPGEALPRDVEVLRAGLVALRAPEARLDCHDGGAPFRFLLAQACVLPGRTVELVGTPRLGERPHAPLLAALRAALGPHGLVIEPGTPWPLRVRTPAAVPPVRFTVDASLSSQFASALLLAASRNGSSVELGEALASEGYFQLTQRWLAAFGFRVVIEGPVLRPVVEREPPAVIDVPGDWSSLGYLLLLSWVSGEPVGRVRFATGHPDEHLVDLLSTVGLSLDANDVLRGRPHGGLEVNAALCPDSVPTLAVLATCLPTPSRFAHAAILRVKESDRLAATQRLLAAAGVHAEVRADVLHVTPGQVTSDFDFDALDDHRMAMCAAVLARLHGRRVRLRGADSVAKSFPGFWDEARKAGVEPPERSGARLEDVDGEVGERRLGVAHELQESAPVVAAVDERDR